MGAIVSQSGKNAHWLNLIAILQLPTVTKDATTISKLISNLYFVAFSSDYFEQKKVLILEGCK